MKTTYFNTTSEQLERAEKLNPLLNALISIDKNGALKQAEEADRAADRSEWLGPLHGMTLAIKDNIDISNQRTTAGARFLSGNVPSCSAHVVTRLLDAGATIVGKANMAELAFGSRSYSAIGGQCRNPWNPDCIPGGSSGGSAVSVASGMCTGSLGSDTGGSVRIPAALNGVTGLRPTIGRVSNRGVVAVSEFSDTVGPMAKNVSDAAQIFAVIAGYDSKDPVSRNIPVPNFLPGLRDGIKGRRIGIPRNFYFDNVDEEVGRAVMDASRVFEREGAVIVDIDVTLAGETQLYLARIVHADICRVHKHALDNEVDKISPSVYERMRRGLDVSGVEYSEALSYARQWKLELRDMFSSIDMLLSPTTLSCAPPIEDGASLYEATSAVTRNTYAGALGGIPGLSIPCGLNSGGMPIGLQLEAAWWNEPLLLQAGYAYQRVTEFHNLQPLC